MSKTTMHLDLNMYIYAMDTDKLVLLIKLIKFKKLKQFFARHKPGADQATRSNWTELCSRVSWCAGVCN